MDELSRILVVFYTWRGESCIRLISAPNFSLLTAQKVIYRGDVTYAAGSCFRSVACMNQILFAINKEYLLNEKGAVAFTKNFEICPQNYQ